MGSEMCIRDRVLEGGVVVGAILELGLAAGLVDAKLGQDVFGREVAARVEQVAHQLGERAVPDFSVFEVGVDAVAACLGRLEDDLFEAGTGLGHGNLALVWCEITEA